MGFVEFFNRPFPLTQSVPLWMFCLLVLVVCGITEGLKIPIKLLTNKITNDRKRHRINLVIIALPVGLGMLAMYIVSLVGYELTTKAIVYDGAYCGKSAIVLYEVFSRIITIVKKRKNENGKVTVGDVIDAFTDGLLDGKQNAKQALDAALEIADEVGASKLVEDNIAIDVDFDINKIVGDIIDKYTPKDDGNKNK